MTLRAKSLTTHLCQCWRKVNHSPKAEKMKIQPKQVSFSQLLQLHGIRKDYQEQWAWATTLARAHNFTDSSRVTCQCEFLIAFWLQTYAIAGLAPAPSCKSVSHFIQRNADFLLDQVVLFFIPYLALQCGESDQLTDGIQILRWGNAADPMASLLPNLEQGGILWLRTGTVVEQGSTLHQTTHNSPPQELILANQRKEDEGL